MGRPEGKTSREGQAGKDTLGTTSWETQAGNAKGKKQADEETYRSEVGGDAAGYSLAFRSTTT